MKFPACAFTAAAVAAAGSGGGGCLVAARPTAANATCDSRRAPAGTAIRTLPHGHNGPTLDLASADDCEAACCARDGCRAWCFTAVTREACPHDGCCFLKDGTQQEINAAVFDDAGYTAGCVGFDCAAAPGPAPPFSYVTPVYALDRVFAEVDGVTLRDPTTAVFDPVTNTWHVYCTRVNAPGQGGYPGVIWHWVLNSTDVLDASVPWADGGSVLNASGTSGAFDASGVFTPGMVRECTNISTAAHDAKSTRGAAADAQAHAAAQSCKWHLFFGGVPDQSSNHTEKVGVAIGDSPWGPFERYEANPVFSFEDANSEWCHGTQARVDEIKATTVGGRKSFLVKSVCNNASALPVVYHPQDDSAWGPPYVVGTPAGPIFSSLETCDHKGFEEPTIYLAPDGNVHFQGHDHGRCSDGTYTHYVNRPGVSLYDDWVQVAPFSTPLEEPVPIPTAGDGVFGGEIMDTWIDFPGLKLCFVNVTWRWTNSTATTTATATASATLGSGAAGGQ